MSTARRQKIFIDATPLLGAHLSGVGQVTLETLRALDDDRYRDRYDIRAFVPITGRRTMRDYAFRNIRTIAIPLPSRPLSVLTRAPFPLDLLLGRGVYVFPNFRNWSLAFSASATYIHDACFAIYPQFVAPRTLAVLQKNIGRWQRRSDRIITVSESSKAELHRYVNIEESRIDVVRNTVDSTFFAPASPDEVARIKRLHGLDRYLLFVGNIEPRKNLITLIDAFERAELPGRTTLFLVGGNGWLDEEITAKIEHAVSLGLDVRKSGSYVPDEDLPALLTGAVALVLPSWHEGFGLPALQAIACGTPAICSDIPALREVAAGHAEGVVFFDPNDPHELAALITASMVKAGIADETRTITTGGVGRTWRDAADELLRIADAISSRHRR